MDMEVDEKELGSEAGERVVLVSVAALEQEVAYNIGRIRIRVRVEV